MDGRSRQPTQVWRSRLCWNPSALVLTLDRGWDSLSNRAISRSDAVVRDGHFGVRRVELYPFRAGAASTIEVRAPLPHLRASPLACTRLGALTDRPRARCAHTGSRSGDRHRCRRRRLKSMQPAAGSLGGGDRSFSFGSPTLHSQAAAHAAAGGGAFMHSRRR